MKDLTRRDAIRTVAAWSALTASGCGKTGTEAKALPLSPSPSTDLTTMDTEKPPMNPVLQVERLPSAGPWPTRDPFLFCVHHNDEYPAGNGTAGPKASLEGRQMGSDFSNKDNWNMYHGEKIAGFPRHPHRGFETITVVGKGLIDHADSLGAAARYGDGDVQWLTAGDGINHAEMFPLLNTEGKNPTDFYQIWINLPASHKRVDPYFSMFWDPNIPILKHQDENQRKTEVRVIAGALDSHTPLSPPPDSWASQPQTEVALWTIKMEAGATWTLPSGSPALNRTLYVVKGNGATIGKVECPVHHQIALQSDLGATVVNGNEPGEYLLLQGKPIGEPIARRGPFVMNTWDEIRQAYSDYQRTQFGGWPWPSMEPTHGLEPGRFARRGDQIERPKQDKENMPG